MTILEKNHASRHQRRERLHWSRRRDLVSFRTFKNFRQALPALIELV